MEARINNGKNSYLYCSIDCQVSNYQEMYNSSEEAFEDIQVDIITECNEKGYDEYEIEKVLSHYEISFNNAGGTWKNIY